MTISCFPNTNRCGYTYDKLQMENAGLAVHVGLYAPARAAERTETLPPCMMKL